MRIDFSSKSVFMYPLNKQYKCKPGYVTADGKISGLITCQQSDWSTQPVCISKQFIILIFCILMITIHKYSLTLFFLSFVCVCVCVCVVEGHEMLMWFHSWIWKDKLQNFEKMYVNSCLLWLITSRVDYHRTLQFMVFSR